MVEGYDTLRCDGFGIGVYFYLDLESSVYEATEYLWKVGGWMMGEVKLD